MKPHVLIIDDEQNIVLSLSLALRKEFEVDAALTAAEGLAKLRAGTYELVLLDLMIGEDDGLQVLEQIRAISPQIQVIMITAFGTFVCRRGQARRVYVSDETCQSGRAENLYVSGASLSGNERYDCEPHK